MEDHKKNNGVFHFLAIQRPKLMMRLLRKLAKFSPFVVLDLEDTLWDILNSERTSQLKEEGRNFLLETVINYPESFIGMTTYIRINKLNSVEFEKDLDLLKQISSVIGLHGIFVPRWRVQTISTKLLVF